MKNLIKRTRFAIYILLSVSFLACKGLIIKDDVLVVKEIKYVNVAAGRYRVDIGELTLFTDSVYMVGDTLKICR